MIGRNSYVLVPLESFSPFVVNYLWRQSWPGTCLFLNLVTAARDEREDPCRALDVMIEALGQDIAAASVTPAGRPDAK